MLKKMFGASLVAISSLSGYEYQAAYDMPGRIELNNGNIEHQRFMKITDAYYLEGGYGMNESVAKDGKYSLIEQDWTVKDGEQFLVYMKLIKDNERYDMDPFKYIKKKKLEIYYDTEFMYMQFEGEKKRFEIKPEMIRKFRKYNKDIVLNENKIFIQKDFNIGNLYLKMKIY